MKEFIGFLCLGTGAIGLLTLLGKYLFTINFYLGIAYIYIILLIVGVCLISIELY